MGAQRTLRKMDRQHVYGRRAPDFSSGSGVILLTRLESSNRGISSSRVLLWRHGVRDCLATLEHSLRSDQVAWRR
jgi:hypothetical protein